MSDVDKPLNKKNQKRLDEKRGEGKGCSGQLKLATVLELSQCNRSGSLGVRPPLY